MRIKSATFQSDKNKDSIHLLILLTITLCIGVYLISTTVLIAKDGVTFIEYAQKLSSDAIAVMVSEDQHPGYPFLILTAHRMAKIASGSASIWSWIYSAQFMALAFRLLTVTVLYFVGKEIVGPKLSFLAILILILLPKPAGYGSDALSDWPYLFFLASGFLLLIRGALNKKWWQFGFAGLAAGSGYLVRPECAQLVVFGSLWTAWQLWGAKRTIARDKAVFMLALLLVGFFIPAVPYMKLKGAIFPKKDVGQFGFSILDSRFSPNIEHQVSSFAPKNMAKAFDELIEEIGDTLMWFFGPALLLGAYEYFRQRNWHKPQKFFTAVLIALNVALMIWLFCKYDYISGRHILPLVVFTIFFVPIGLQIFGNWLRAMFCKSRLESNQDSHLWFSTLVIAGLAICTPKLLTPIRAEKHSYREAARWFANHTDQKDIIAVPDARISFYAQREGLNWTAGQIPEQAQYAVRIFEEDNQPTVPEQLGKVEYKYVDKKNERVSLVIYRKQP
ncbi:MAG: glycosyltransferase family 39 protein [Sedimentisphaerales bacterium]